jgi:hypothetical protein
MNLNRDPQQPAPHAVSIHAVAPNPTVLAGNNIPQGDPLMTLQWLQVRVPKVFGMHEIELQPGVEPEDYERFFAEELAPTLKLPGWKTHLLRGDRGARGGKYLVLHEIESLDARDRYFPGPGEQSEEFTRFLEQHPETAAAMEKWERYSTIHSENDITTDYVAVAE